MNILKDKVVVITGAGSGIGRALALEFATQGAQLALSDVDQKGLEQTAALLPIGSTSRLYAVNVASRQAVFDHATQVQRDFGVIHYVVNNAGTSVLATFEHSTMDEIERVLAINLWGVIYGTKAFLPIMLAQKEGCLVNISSVFGLVATPCSAAYTMSKFAVRGLTETLWQELEGTGVRAVLVHPGGINTNISKVPRATQETDLERKVMAGNIKMMTTPPEVCARQIVAGLLKGKNRLLVGNGARALFWMARLLPDSYGGLIRRSLGL